MMSGFRDDGYDEPLEPGEESMVEEQQLPLADEDERLPWLEADEDYQEEGIDTARVVAFALIGLVAVLALIGAGWWFTRDSTPVTERVAAGGTIEAPDEPYKTRPEDPGGMEVAGTGDVSFGVGEGQRTEGVVRDKVPAPSIDRRQGADGSAEPPTDSEPKPDMSGVGVQVAAYSSRAGAQTGWGVLSSRIPALQGVNHRIVQAVVDGATVYRLQAVAGSVDSAQELCRNIRSQGGDCQVKR